MCIERNKHDRYKQIKGYSGIEIQCDEVVWCVIVS